jgi:hypothetical protein
MDPLSFSASLITVLDLTVTLMRFVNDVRHAPRERSQIAREASNIYALLTTLRFRVEEADSDDPWFDQVKALAVADGPLDEFQVILKQLVVKIQPASKLKDLLWKFAKHEVEVALTRIERLKSLVTLALANDLFTLAQSLKDDTSGIAHEIQQLQLQSESEWSNKLSTWLDVPDPSSNFATACKRRQPGTAKWLFDDERFLAWNEAGTGSSIWLHGIPGWWVSAV